MNKSPINFMTLGIIAISVFLVLGMGSSYSNIVSASTVEQPQQHAAAAD